MQNFYLFKTPISSQIRLYSSKPSNLDFNPETELNPVALLTLTQLADKNYIISQRNILQNKSGIYYFINTVNNKQYIGSAKDFFVRLNEHLNNKKSNINLQKAFVKYGLDKFHFVIYEYFTYGSKVLSNKGLTDLETRYIKFFDITELYNIKTEAVSLIGYKHT
uniref:homing endonuclease n=1 Tax=Leptographium procerum TaxID=100367 RepID=UPI0023F43710|nr:homing endonuclease [Leptographium procerum]WDW20999.1 homing endonuclease [Leptographium procerum]WDZ67181.1 homing endonuclease [Leptographium procerum]